MKNIPALQGLKVLITRPLSQAQSLTAAIIEQGGIPILFPTIEIIPCHDPSFISQIMQQLSEYDFAIFVSANAVIQVMPFWPETASSLKIIAIGPATAKALAQFSFKAVFPQHHNSEALLNLPDLQQIKGKRILIFSGVGGRTLIADTLRQRGGHVVVAEVYRRVLPTASHHREEPWQKNDLDIIVCTSNESLRNLLTLISQPERTWLLQKPLLVISERMLTYARELGFTTIPLLAEMASDKAILTALKAWYASRF